MLKSYKTMRVMFCLYSIQDRVTFEYVETLTMLRKQFEIFAIRDGI